MEPESSGNDFANMGSTHTETYAHTHAHEALRELSIIWRMRDETRGSRSWKTPLNTCTKCNCQSKLATMSEEVRDFSSLGKVLGIVLSASHSHPRKSQDLRTKLSNWSIQVAWTGASSAWRPEPSNRRPFTKLAILSAQKRKAGRPQDSQGRRIQTPVPKFLYDCTWLYCSKHICTQVTCTHAIYLFMIQRYLGQSCLCICSFSSHSDY